MPLIGEKPHSTAIVAVAAKLIRSWESLRGNLLSKRLVEALSRAGVTSLYEVAGRGAVDLLGRIESRTVNASGLAQLVVDRFGASQALQSPQIRRLALSSLKLGEADGLCEILGFDRDDPFASLAEVDIGRSDGLMATLHAYFGVPYERPEETEQKSAQLEVRPPYTLFPHQRLASLKVREKLARPRARVLLHMPTGAGKTRTAMTTIVDLLRGTEDGQVVLWLAHSEELCDQAFDEAVKAWAAIGSRGLTIHRHYGSTCVGR